MTLLQTHGLTASYGQLRALFGVDIRVDAGEMVAIIGANGAGKTTLLRSITGALRNEVGMVIHRGQAIGAMAADQIMKRGIAMVPEGRCLFASLFRRGKPADRRAGPAHGGALEPAGDL